MKIRIKIAMFLIWLSRKIHPQPTRIEIEPVEAMVAKQVGLAVGLSKKDVRRYKIDHDLKSSRKAKAGLVKETIEINETAIFDKVKELIEVEVFKDGEYTVVDSRLNVYVPKEDC